MKKLVETVVRRLADHPDEARVFETFDGKTAVYEIEVPEAERGRLIGREGRTVRALRALRRGRRIRARSARHDPHPGLSAPGASPDPGPWWSWLMDDEILVGVVRRPHGLAGEVSVQPLTDFPERFAAGIRGHLAARRRVPRAAHHAPRGRTVSGC